MVLYAYCPISRLVHNISACTNIRFLSQFRQLIFYSQFHSDPVLPSLTQCLGLSNVVCKQRIINVCFTLHFSDNLPPEKECS